MSGASVLAHDLSQVPHPPRSRDLSFYLVLLFAVGPLWLVGPASWVFVLWALHFGHIFTFGWAGHVCFAIALAEAFFSVYHAQLARSIAGPSPIVPGKLSELQIAFKRVLQAGLAALGEGDFDEETLDMERPGSPEETIEQLTYDDPRAVDFRNSLRTWFGKAPWSAIRAREVRAWLYWSIFNAPLPESDALPHHHGAVLDEVEELLHRRAGCVLPPGSNPDAPPLLLTLDRVNVCARPLAWYLFVAGVNLVLRKRMEVKWGVRMGAYGGLEYIIRTPVGWSPTTGPRPIVIIHGLGLGLFQYHLFLTHLFDTLGDRPILVPLQPHISQDIFHRRFLCPLGRHETADRLAGLLQELGWVDLEESEDVIVAEGKEARQKGVTVLSHSNGSYTHAWLLKAFPYIISRSCFVDPVTFCSWEGDVCYNFIYRPACTGLELVMRYFVGTELGVANLLQRHFDWSSNSLWYDEIPHARDPTRTVFFVGGNDAILDAQRVRRYLRAHGVREGLRYDPAGHHGQALLAGGPGHREILRWLREEHAPRDRSLGKVSR